VQPSCCVVALFEKKEALFEKKEAVFEKKAPRFSKNAALFQDVLFFAVSIAVL
jgi:hypothetical protein